MTLEQCGVSGSTPYAVKNPPAPAISASKTEESINDSPKGRKLKRFGQNQDSDPSSFDTYSLFQSLVEHKLSPILSYFDDLKIEKNSQISRPVQLKLMLFKGQLY